MSNIKLLHTKPQKTQKEYLADCQQRKYYNQQIAKKLHNALQIEEETLQGLAEIDFRYYDDYTEINKFKKQTINMHGCCNRFFAEIWESESLQDVKRKTKPFRTCKNKLCAICCKIRSNKLFNETYNVIDFIKKSEIEFIPYHLTLTIKNPTYNKFADYYKIMNEAIHDMFDIHQKSKVYNLRKYVLGWQCAREVSQSLEAKNAGELHPHLHILLLISKDLFVGKNRKIGNKEILAEWNFALKAQDQNFPNVTQIAFKKIQATKADSLINAEANAIAEVSKYPTKPGDMLDMPDDILLSLLKNLSGARMVTFGGVIKQVRQQLGYSNNVDVVDAFIKPELYKLAGIKLYNFSNGIYKRQNIRKADLLEYRVISSSEMLELTYSENKEELKNRSAGVDQFLSNDFSEIDKNADIAKYKKYENIKDSDLAKIGTHILSLANEDYEEGQNYKLLKKILTSFLQSQLIYYSNF